MIDEKIKELSSQFATLKMQKDAFTEKVNELINSLLKLDGAILLLREFKAQEIELLQKKKNKKKPKEKK